MESKQNLISFNRRFAIFYLIQCLLPNYLLLLRSETWNSPTEWVFLLCVWYLVLFISDYQYGSKDGYVSDVLIGIYADYAMCGFGGIIQEATAVVPEGRISDL